MSEINPATQVVFWHRELPPVAADVVDEHVVEATSGRVAGTLSHRDELWEQCYHGADDPGAGTHRAGGGASRRPLRARVDESIDSKHDDATGEAWLHGRFSYVLYRKASEGAQPG